MSVYTMEELARHAGHDIHVVTYGTNERTDNAAIECWTCNIVLFDVDANKN